MPKVVRRTNSNGELESLDDLLRRFRRQVNDANILGECRKREFFVSNGEKKKERKLKKQMAIRKAQQEARRAEYKLNAFNYQLNNVGPTKPVTPNKPVVQQKQPVVKTDENQKSPKPTKPAYYSYRKPAPKKEEGK